MSVEAGLTIAERGRQQARTPGAPQGAPKRGAGSAAEVRRHLAFIDRKISFYEDTLDE
jgi:hypothetical protein